MFALPLDIRLRPSVGLLVLLMAAHALACAVPWLMGMPASLSLALTVTIMSWGLLQTLDKALHRQGNSIVGLRFTADGAVRLRLRNGQEVEASLASVPLCSEWGVVLKLRTPLRRYGTVVIWADGCGEAQFRRLRVFVRWGRPQGEGSGLA